MIHIKSCRYETVKFSNNLNGDICKRIFSLKENTDHNKQFLELTQGGGENHEYYTFKKCKQSIICYIHRQEIIEKNSTQLSQNHVRELQIAQNNFDPCVSAKESASVAPIGQALSFSNYSSGKSSSLYKFTVTQKRISFQEFSTMYFEYLIPFLRNYIHSNVGVKDVRFRFCVIRDSYAEGNGFKLTDEDIYNVTNDCGMISRASNRFHNRLFVLERVEATAIYCRKLIRSIDTNNRTNDLGFIQLQLTTDRCLILINRASFVAEQDGKRQVKKLWSAIYRYSKSATFPFNFTDVTCENLWTHVQKHQHNLLNKCKRHQLCNSFFNSTNMSVFYKLLRVYFSTVRPFSMRKTWIWNVRKMNCFIY